MAYKNSPVRSFDEINKSEYISIAEASVITGIPAMTISNLANQTDATYVLKVGNKGGRRMLNREAFLCYLNQLCGKE